MLTNQPFGPPGASAAAEAVGAHLTASPFPTSDVSAKWETAVGRGRPTTGECP